MNRSGLTDDGFLYVSTSEIDMDEGSLYASTSEIDMNDGSLYASTSEIDVCFLVSLARTITR